MPNRRPGVNIRFSNNFIINDFSFGLDWTTPSYRVAPGWLVDAKNINLTSFHAAKKRGGIQKLYSTALDASPVYSIFEYLAPDATNRVLITTGTKLGYYSAGAWVTLRNNLVGGIKSQFAMHNGFCYIVNGVDPNYKLYNSIVYENIGIPAPTTIPTVAAGALTDLTGKYQYVYAYQRSYPDNFIGNYSEPSAEITVNAGSVAVSYTKSMNPEVDKIVIYRTLNLNAGGSAVQFYQVAIVDNSTSTYDDEADDNDITVMAANTNTVPPLAKFILLHKDRMIYANCPNEPNGGSLFMFSEIGSPESVPTGNYQYLDRSDGSEITGIASLPDYLVIFKKNKIAIMEGDFEQWYVISPTIGCIAPWAIITMTDKVAFLSEEGWKFTDGKNVYDIGKRLQTLYVNKYATLDAAAHYSAAYYPNNKQMMFLLYHPTFVNYMMVGHWLQSLYELTSLEFQEAEKDVGWTYHQYPYQVFTCISTFTDSNGITRLIVGADDGFIYELDYENDDDGYSIEMNLETGWHTLGAPASVTKTLRYCNIVYAGNELINATVRYDTDFAASSSFHLLHGIPDANCGTAYSGIAYCGMEGILSENFDFDDTACGRVFRYAVNETSAQAFTFMSIESIFRPEGIR